MQDCKTLYTRKFVANKGEFSTVCADTFTTKYGNNLVIQVPDGKFMQIVDAENKEIFSVDPIGGFYSQPKIKFSG